MDARLCAAFGAGLAAVVGRYFDVDARISKQYRHSQLQPGKADGHRWNWLTRRGGSLAGCSPSPTCSASCIDLLYAFGVAVLLPG